ncbi:MAG: DNA primase [bacterium]
MIADWDMFIQEVMNRIDLAEFIGQYTTLKKSGSRFMGLCPFHGENDPSLSVSPDVSLWHCFGCKKGGNVFTFVMEKENMNFMEAAELLSERCRIDLPKGKGHTDKTPKKAFFEMHKIAEGFYSKYILSDQADKFKKYLRARNINKQTVLAFGIGASPDSWNSLCDLLKRNNYTENLIVQSGLAIRSEKGNIYDRFRNRLIIPIRDHMNRTVGFGGRVLDDSEPKYLNSSESAIFKKSDLLFAFADAKNAIIQNDSVIIMEGYTDVIRAHQNGILNTVASMGTALTSQQISRLSRLTTRFYLAFDGDSAGIQAASRSAEELMRSELQTRVVVFDEGIDPEQFINDNGKDEFIKKLENAKEGIWFLIDQVVPDKLPDSLDANIILLERVLNIVRIVPNKASQEEIISSVARRFSMTKSTVVYLFERKILKKGKSEKTQETDMKSGKSSIEEREWEIMRYAICFPKVRTALKKHLKPTEFQNHLYSKFLSLLFDKDFPLEEKNLQNHPGIFQNEDFVNLVGEMNNSLDDSHEYTITEISEYVSEFKKRLIDQERTKNNQRIEKAKKENDSDKELKLLKIGKELIDLREKYRKKFKLEVE